MKRVRLSKSSMRVRIERPAHVKMNGMRVRLVKPARTRLQVLRVGARVYDLGSTHRIGVLKAVGPEVSEVVWPERSGSKTFRQYVTNEYLRLADA